MNQENTKRADVHSSKEIKGWVHKHRILAKWLYKGLIFGLTSLVVYLKGQEKIIEKEEIESLKK